MMHMRERRLATLVLGLIGMVASGCATGAGLGSGAELESWRATDSRSAIESFVTRVTTPGSPDFVPEPQRIAVFDNDGCLWAEKPVYFQLLFAIDRVRAMAPQHPEWRTTQPFQAVLENDMATLAAAGEEGILELIAATHAGMSVSEFQDTVRSWFETARHPETGRPYTEMVYQPMLELLAYLRANGFKTFIVSGGGLDFLRVFAEEVYGVPAEQVVGTTLESEFVMTAEGPIIRKLAEIDFIDDKVGKPVAIQRHIGRRPIAAFGNSDGDLQMLQWTAAGDGARFCGIVWHTDADREWAYDRESSVGRLDKAQDEARQRGWTLIDMAADWDQVFPPAGG